MVAGRNVRAATVWCETNARIGENLSEHRFFQLQQRMFSRKVRAHMYFPMCPSFPDEYDIISPQVQ